MGRPKKLWSLKVGARNAAVTVYERSAEGNLWLRWWVPATATMSAHDQYRALGHNDRVVALQTAKEIAAQLLASTLAIARGTVTVADVVATYNADVAAYSKGSGAREGKRRALVWTTFLGANTDADSIDATVLDRFVRERRAGAIKLPDTSDFTLRGKVSDRAVGADLEYLRAALRHATRTKRGGKRTILASNPMANYEIPHNRSPRRPAATYDRYLKIVEHADAVDPQKLFAGFMALVEGLGWRVSAICALRARDVDVTEAPTTPHGRIFKNPEHDKEGTGGWIPMSKSVRAGVDQIRAANPAIGDWPLFPAPRARVDGPEHAESTQSDNTDVIALPVAKPAIVEKVEIETEMPKAWSRHHARKLLERAEKKAGLSAMEGSDFHCYRRKWATERKHLPDVDVARAGGWSEKDPRALKRSYQQADELTVLAVVNEPTKLRDAGAVHGDQQKAEGA